MTDSPPPARQSFTAVVRAEELPGRLSWGWRDTVTVLTIPAVFGLTAAGDVFGLGAVGVVYLDTVLRCALFVLLVLMNAALLARHWRAMWAAKWRSIGLVIAGAILIQLTITVTRWLLGLVTNPPADDGTAGEVTLWQLGLLGAILIGFSPVVTALIEDFVFRHTLLLKFPVWRRATSAAVVVIANALLFGAVHINNFDGHWPSTLIYAAAGLVMNLIYLWTRNIWHVLLMHGLNNFLLGGPLVTAFVYLVGAPE